MNAVKSFVDYIRIEKRYSELTVRAYFDDIEQFSGYLNNNHLPVSILEADQILIRHWIISLLNDSISPRSIRRKITALSSFYRFCLKKQWVTKNPAKGVVLPRLEKNLPEFLDETGITNLFSLPQFKEGFSGRRDKLVLELFYATGMRLSELTHLKISSYNEPKGEIKVLGKRNKERLIPLTHNAQRLLDQYLAERAETFPGITHDILIVTDSGNPSYARMIQRLVRKYLLQSTTLDKKNPHLLRHTFATHMLNNGADLNAVKELLGHANLAATEIYTHNTYEKLRSIYKQAHPRA
jgi:integrase/recombinase XerC